MDITAVVVKGRSDLVFVEGYGLLNDEELRQLRKKHTLTYLVGYYYDTGLGCVVNQDQELREQEEKNYRQRQIIETISRSKSGESVPEPEDKRSWLKRKFGR